MKAKGTVGFAGYRDPSGTSTSTKNGMKDPDEMDSDQDDDDDRKKPNGAHVKDEDAMEDEDDAKTLSADEIRKRAELADGVKKIQVCLPLPSSSGRYMRVGR